MARTISIRAGLHQKPGCALFRDFACDHPADQGQDHERPFSRQLFVHFLHAQNKAQAPPRGKYSSFKTMGVGLAHLSEATRPSLINPTRIEAPKPMLFSPS